MIYRLQSTYYWYLIQNCTFISIVKNSEGWRIISLHFFEFFFFPPPLKYPPPRNKKIKFSFIDIFRKLLKKPHMKNTHIHWMKKRNYDHTSSLIPCFLYFQKSWMNKNTLPNLLISSYICLKKNCHPDQINLKLNLLLLFITPLIDVTRD